MQSVIEQRNEKGIKPFCDLVVVTLSFRSLIPTSSEFEMTNVLTRSGLTCPPSFLVGTLPDICRRSNGVESDSQSDIYRIGVISCRPAASRTLQNHGVKFCATPASPTARKN